MINLYKDLFIQAAKSSIHLKLDCPVIEFQEGQILNEVLINQVVGATRTNKIILSQEDLMAKCFESHILLSSLLYHEFNITSYFTLGFVIVDEKPLFKQQIETLSQMLDNSNLKQYSNPLQLHAWLTLQTMEILDFSLATTISFVGDNKSLAGGLIYGFPNDFKEISYHPQLIGENFLERIGAIRYN